MISEKVTPFKTDVDKVQAAVDGAVGLSAYNGGTIIKSTNWLVRSNPDSEYKLVRTNTQFADSYDDVRNAEGPGVFLAVYEGVNCNRVFGE